MTIRRCFILQHFSHVNLGRGYPIGGTVEEFDTDKTTLSQCIGICEHSADERWNGFLWQPSDGLCDGAREVTKDPTRLHEYMHFLRQTYISLSLLRLIVTFMNQKKLWSFFLG